MSNKKQRTCISCKNIVSGRTRKCQECKDKEKKAKERKCISCEKIIIGRTRRCQECKDRIEDEKKNKICKRLGCGIKFRLEEGQKGQIRICPRCKEADFKMAFKTINLFFDDDNPYNYLSSEYRPRIFSSKQRNIIQAVTDYPEFKIKNIIFENVDIESKTWDHINTMTFFIENYLLECIKDPFKKTFVYFKEYLLKYAVQFKVNPKHNMNLISYQVKGITPEEYICVVGPIVDHTEKESVEIIRPHFING